MKFLSAILLTLTVAVSFAQSETTTTYEGRTVNVVPYRLESIGDYESDFEFYHYQSTFEKFHVPYIPDSLVDGEYIMYYSIPEQYVYRWDRKRRNRKLRTEDSFIVALVFNIKNNAKNGPVTFFDYYNPKRPSAKGFYKNDLKHGRWTSLHTKGKKQITIDYNEGVVDGLVIQEDLRYPIQDVTKFVNGKEVMQLDSFTTRQTTYQGRDVTICRYRIHYGENEGNALMDTFVIDPYKVAVIKSQLPDGEYVMLYKPYVDLNSTYYIKQMVKQKHESIAYNFRIKDGAYEGPFYEFDFGEQDLNSKSNSNPTFTAEFHNGQFHGVSAYYNRGKLLSETTWKNGIRNGPEKFYQKGKLVRLTTYRDGKRYGDNYYKTSKDCYERGFAGSDGLDSIREIVCKHRIRQVYTNATTPFEQMDSSELEWYMMPVSHYHHYQTRSSHFTKYEVYNRRAKLVSTEYLYNGYRKIPYTLLNNHGDTVEYAKRSVVNGDSLGAIVSTFAYDKKNRLITSGKYAYSHTNAKQFDSYFAGNLVSWTQYTEGSITERFIFTPGKEHWDGWLTKRDSSIITDRNTKQTTIKETYDIKNMGTFVVYDNTDTSSFYLHLQNQTRHNQFTQNDTVVVTTTLHYGDSLTTSNIYEICLQDDMNTKSYKIQPSINPFHPVPFETEMQKLTGTHRTPVAHKGKPYTGKIHVTEVYATKRDKPYSILEVQQKADGFYITKTTNRRSKKSKHYESQDLPLHTYEFNYVDGYLHGKQICNSDVSLTYALNFNQGHSDGNQIFRNAGYNSDSINCTYSNHVLHGPYTIHEFNGAPLLLTNYKNGKIYGDYLEYSRTRHNLTSTKYPLTKAHFNDHGLHGEFIVYQYGIEKESITFVNGQVTGPYASQRIEYINRDKSDSSHNFLPYHRGIPTFNTTLKNGAIQDSAFGYFSDGRLKYVVVISKDFQHTYIEQKVANDQVWVQKTLPNFTSAYNTSQFNYYSNTEPIYSHGRSHSGNNGLNLDPLTDYVTGVYTFFYKSGAVAQKGFMIDGKKDGLWHYWSEAGTLMKSVFYDKSGYQTAKHITTYYPNGNKLMTGRVAKQESTYQCDVELFVPVEKLIYTSYYDAEGKNIINNGNCTVVEYHINGSVRYKGQLENSSYAGLWMYYTPDGTLNEIGEYVDGYKHGRWLKGDLSGINYLDNACSMDEALSLIKEMQQKNIDVQEIYYEKGKELSSSHHSLEKL